MSRPTRAGSRGTIEKIKGSLLMSAADWKRSWPAWLRATAIGFPFGTIPAGGSEIPTFLSYATEKKLTKHPEEFGKGAIEGVAGPEAANNAVGDRRARSFADAWESRPPRPRPSCSARSRTTGCSPVPCCSSPKRTWSGA